MDTRASGSADSAATIQLVTAASEPVKAKALLDSADRAGLVTHVVGAGETFTGFGWKLRHLYEGARDLCTSEYVLIVDAYDSLICASAEELALRAGALGPRILISAEINCYPEGYLASEYPHTDSPYRYLNAGGILAERKLFVETLEKWNIDRVKPRHDDQRFFTHFFLLHPEIISLDYQCEVFQCMNAHCPPGSNCNCGKQHLTDKVSPRNGRPYNTVVNSSPMVLHFNGNTPRGQWVEFVNGPHH